MQLVFLNLLSKLNLCGVSKLTWSALHTQHTYKKRVLNLSRWCCPKSNTGLILCLLFYNRSQTFFWYSLIITINHCLSCSHHFLYKANMATIECEKCPALHTQLFDFSSALAQKWKCITFSVLLVWTALLKISKWSEMSSQSKCKSMQFGTQLKSSLHSLTHLFLQVLGCPGVSPPGAVEDTWTSAADVWTPGGHLCGCSQICSGASHQSVEGQ